MLALASCQTAPRATFIMQTNSPHVFNVSAPAFQYTQRDRNQGQTHHPCDIKELFEIKNKRAVGPQQKWDRQQRHHPQHIHSDPREVRASNITRSGLGTLLNRYPARVQERREAPAGPRQTLHRQKLFL